MIEELRVRHSFFRGCESAIFGVGGCLGLIFGTGGHGAGVHGNLIEIPFCRFGNRLRLHMSKGKLFLLEGELLGAHVGYSWPRCEALHLSALSLLYCRVGDY